MVADASPRSFYLIGATGSLLLTQQEPEDQEEKITMAQITTLRPQHKIMAMMWAQGARNVDIADSMQLDENYVSIVKNSPVMLAEIERLQKNIEDHGLASFLDEVINEQRPNLHKLKDLRDSGEEESTQLGAARAIMGYFEFAQPKRTKHEEESKFVISIETEALKTLQGAVSEYKQKVRGERESEVVEIESKLEPEVVIPVAMTLDEYLANNRNDDG